MILKNVNSIESYNYFEDWSHFSYWRNGDSDGGFHNKGLGISKRLWNVGVSQMVDLRCSKGHRDGGEEDDLLKHLFSVNNNDKYREIRE